MKSKQALPYVAALFLLAWILGTLARAGPGTTSILANSYWLLYIVYFLPLFALGFMVVMIIFLAMNWRMLSSGIGSGIARRKRKPARFRSLLARAVVGVAAWSIAIMVLYLKCGGIFCSSNDSTPLSATVENIVSGDNQGPRLPHGPAFLPLSLLTEIVSSPVFGLAFLGLVLVSTVILVASLRFAVQEGRATGYMSEETREEGMAAVQDALRVLEVEEPADPRARIMACYEKMIRAAARLGADVTVDKTARELELGIRHAFRLEGSGIADLTRLFEEARYSLHPIAEADSELAQRSLLEIGRELKAATTALN